MADNELRRRRLKIIQVLLLVDDLEDEKGRNRERIIWTRSWIRRREERGVYHQLIRELALVDVALKVSGGEAGNSDCFQALAGPAEIECPRLDTNQGNHRFSVTPAVIVDMDCFKTSSCRDRMVLLLGRLYMHGCIPILVIVLLLFLHSVEATAAFFCYSSPCVLRSSYVLKLKD